MFSVLGGSQASQVEQVAVPALPTVTHHQVQLQQQAAPLPAPVHLQPVPIPPAVETVPVLQFCLPSESDSSGHSTPVDTIPAAR